MLRGLEGGDALLPFVSQFYGSPSTYLWEDDEGVVHEISQGATQCVGGNPGTVAPFRAIHGIFGSHLWLDPLARWQDPIVE